MEKISVDYKKLYYGFPVILISFYDKDGNPNVTTLSSSYTLTDMVNLTHIKSKIINAPIIEECPIAIECTLTDVIERDYYKGITNILAKIHGRNISKEYLDSDGQLKYSAVENVLYVGDDKKKVYRYTKSEVSDDAQSFL